MILVFFTFALFASAIFANKLILATLPPTFFVGIRMFLAGAILVAYTWKKHPLTKAYLRQDLAILLTTAFLTTCVPTLLKAFALKYLNAAQATLLGSIDPFVTALYAYILWREPLTIYRIIGIFCGCLGVILVLNVGQQDVTALWQGNLIVPQMAALTAVVIGRWGWILIQRLLRRERYPAAQLNGIVMLGSGIVALAASIFVDPLSSLIIPVQDISFWALMAYTIVVGNVIAYTIYANLLKKYSITLISLAGFSVPLFVALLSKIYTGTPLSLQFLTAAGIMFLGLIIFYHDELYRARAK